MLDGMIGHHHQTDFVHHFFHLEVLSMVDVKHYYSLLSLMETVTQVTQFDWFILPLSLLDDISSWPSLSLDVSVVPVDLLSTAQVGSS